MILKESSEYIKLVSKEKRKKEGQYFTDDYLKNVLLSNLNIKENNTILEPSVGTGEFVAVLPYKKNIVAIEKDELVYSLFKKNFQDVISYNIDFFGYDESNKFDFIIGNPPFFEVKKDKKYSFLSNGRLNIATLFVYKSLNMLNQDGILAFVLPCSFLSSSFFLKIRQFIHNNFNIKKIIKANNTFLFNGALQDVCVLIVKKEKPTNDYKVIIDNNIIFSDDSKQINNLLAKYTNLKQLNCSVETGSIVWNQNKENFSEEGVPLIYGENIKNNNIVFKKLKYPKGQYIKITKEPIKEKCIVVNRITGRNINIKKAIVDFPFYAENHVSVIKGNNLENIFLRMELNEEKKFILKNLIGTTQLSKTELLTIYPIDKTN